MKRILMVSMILVMLFATGFTPVSAARGTAQASKARTYTVLVGADNPGSGASVMSFFPGKLTIRVGDTVVWKANSHELHTVTFLGGETTSLPDFVIPITGQSSPFQLNPLAAFPNAPTDGQYDGTTYVNSGLMSKDPYMVKTFQLTFSKAGVYPYVCIVHGQMMSGEITVVAADSTTVVPNPSAARSQGAKEISAAMKQVPALVKEALSKVPASEPGQGGTTVHHVMVGYASGNIMLMKFFPSVLQVKQGDTVVWSLPTEDSGPHTVTFVGYNPEPPMVMPVPTESGPPILLINPWVLIPSNNASTPLNNLDYFNSGFLQAGVMGGRTSYILTVGAITGRIRYICVLHDTSGMVGSLVVSKTK